MKEYTPEALGTIYEYFECLTSERDNIFDLCEQGQESLAFLELADIAYEMMVGRHDDCCVFDAKYRSDTGPQLYDYEHILPYANDLGIQVSDSYESICEEGGCQADYIITEMVNLITEALIKGIRDNWEYLTSDEQ